MAFRAHAAVRQDLRDGVFRSRALFEFVRAAECLDVVERMVKADVLQRIRNALNQVFLLDDSHGLNVWGRDVIGTSWVVSSALYKARLELLCAYSCASAGVPDGP